MNLRQLEYAVAVADLGGFSRAAEALHVTQPALSEGIAVLERSLGVRLFRRDVRPVVPTDAGRAVVAQARRALRGVEQVREVVTDVSELRVGTLRIAAPGQVAASRLAASLATYCRRHPNVEVHVEAPSHVDEVADMVTSARCDVGITFRPVPSSLVAMPFGEVEFVLVCPPGTELGPPPVDIDDLPGRVILPIAPDLAAAELRSLERHPTDVAVAVQTGLRELVVPLVLAGVGVTFLPTDLAEGARAQGAVVSPVAPPITLGLMAMHRPADLPPAAAAFLDVVRETTA